MTFILKRVIKHDSKRLRAITFIFGQNHGALDYANIENKRTTISIFLCTHAHNHAIGMSSFIITNTTDNINTFLLVNGWRYTTS